MSRVPFFKYGLLPLALAVLLAPAASVVAGLYEDGAGARAMGMGGAGAAVADDPMSALFDNPAALSDIDRLTVQIGGDGAWAHGAFHNRVNDDAQMDEFGGIGEFAASIPAGPVRFAVGVNPDIAAETDWHYRDAPGGADGATTYGERKNASRILLLRSAAGASWQVAPTLALGANLGLLYNDNQLQTPYVFQSQPTLRTAKTLLDLHADGFGWNAEGGLRWRPIPSLSVNVVYTSPSQVDSHGHATGNAGVQFANLGLGAAKPDFKYNAEVTNKFPQQVSAGISWKARPQLTIGAQFDWINWADAFGSLPVRLTNGDNADLNGLVGSHRLNDNVPLRWGDQYVGRVGIEQGFGSRWTLRAGYSYGNDPVPAGTLTPLNAAITEHLLTFGAGYKVGRVRADLAYQWLVPATGRVRVSDLAAGEYSQSVVEVSVHRLNLSVGISF